VRDAGGGQRAVAAVGDGAAAGFERAGADLAIDQRGDVV